MRLLKTCLLAVTLSGFLFANMSAWAAPSKSSRVSKSKVQKAAPVAEIIPTEVITPASPNLSTSLAPSSSRFDWHSLKPAVGAQIGTNISNSTVNSTMPVPPISPTLGVAVGANLELAINDKFFIQPEILFIQKGFRTNFSNVNAVANFNYLELPVLFKAKFDLKPIRPYALAGLSAAVLVSQSMQTTVDSFTQTTTGFDTSSVDFNLIVGGGGEMDIAQKIALFANLRYALGLRNISNVSNYTVRNNGLALLLGPKFSL